MPRRASAAASGWRGATPGSGDGGPRRGSGAHPDAHRCVRSGAPVWAPTPSLQRLPVGTWRHPPGHAAIDWPGAGCVVGGWAVRPNRHGETRASLCPRDGQGRCGVVPPALWLPVRAAARLRSGDGQFDPSPPDTVRLRTSRHKHLVAGSSHLQQLQPWSLLSDNKEMYTPLSPWAHAESTLRKGPVIWTITRRRSTATSLGRFHDGEVPPTGPA